MILSVDTHLLLYSLNPASVWHIPATTFLKQYLGNPSAPFAITDYVLVELYTLLRNPAVMSRPLAAPAARDLVTSYWRIPNVMRIENANVMDQVWTLAGTSRFARRRIFDARIALTLQHGGVTHFATANTKDFQDWGFEKVWNPLVEQL